MEFLPISSHLRNGLRTMGDEFHKIITWIDESILRNLTILSSMGDEFRIFMDFGSSFLSLLSSCNRSGDYCLRLFNFTVSVVIEGQERRPSSNTTTLFWKTKSYDYSLWKEIDKTRPGRRTERERERKPSPNNSSTVPGALFFAGWDWLWRRLPSTCTDVPT